MDNLNDESVILALDLRNVLGFPDTEGDAALTVEDTHQVYRSARGPLEAPPGVEHMDSFDAPVYRSMGPSVAIPAHLDLGIPAHASDDEWDAKGLLHALPCAPGALPLALARGGSAAEVPSLGIPLPADAFDCVLSFLSAHPDLFQAMRVNSHWCRVVRAHYERRVIRVPPGADGLGAAVRSAGAGDTVVLEPGVHHVGATVHVTKPIRIIAADEGEEVIVWSQRCVALRMCASATLASIRVHRSLPAGAHPNSAVHVECGTTEMRGCTVLGSASGGEDPAPVRVTGSPDVPQAGVTVGPGGRLDIEECTVAHHRGPAIKVCRGELAARACVMRGSACGANVVINGGVAEVLDSEVSSSQGDGLSCWNAPRVTIARNSITGNAGAGVALHSCGAEVLITDNHFEDNSTPVAVATSNTRGLLMWGNSSHTSADSVDDATARASDQPGVGPVLLSLAAVGKTPSQWSLGSDADEAGVFSGGVLNRALTR